MTRQKDTKGNNEDEARTTGFASFVSRIKQADRLTLALYGSVIAAIIVMAIVVIFVIKSMSSDVAPEGIPGDSAPQATVYRHPLTGERLDAPLDSLPQVFAVMVENAADAWPLVGLDDAFLVIEAPVEGAIPRFEVFFSSEATAGKIGPVRSARPYYLDWADELDAVYVHVGGSPEALDLIRQYGTVDLNEFFQGEYFYRWGARYAPHNAYTTMSDLSRALVELAPGAPEYDSWIFADGERGKGNAQSLFIDWTSGSTYDVTWTYDIATNRYVRAQGGTGLFLEGYALAAADNVVIVESDVTVVDAQGRRHIRTTGQGEAIIAKNGTVTVATWKKETRTDRLRFYAADGKEIAMNAGKTWVQVVPSLAQATVTAWGETVE